MAQEDGHNDLLLGEEVASTTPHVSRRPTSKAARAAPQRAAALASVAQSLPAPNGPLMAARELLRNPPGKAASPDAQRQWRDDVDRLLNLAQASPCSAGGVCLQATPSSGRRIRICALAVSEECTNRRPPGGAQPQTCGRGCPCLHRGGAWSPAQCRGSRPRCRIRCGGSGPAGTCPGAGVWGGLHCARRPPSHGCLTVQVSATPAGEVRRVLQPVRIPAGLHHRHHGGWR
jgi:hypothetical protein